MFFRQRLLNRVIVKNEKRLEELIAQRTDQMSALRNNESRYRELFNAMSDGVGVYEVIDSGNVFPFKDFNRATERITGM
ncbi:MAG: hypothetical protein GY703_02910 [Gammaproteobacteria bacterium]|nr:hypothetical protein [Gammaproteobacteria bacterium]